MLYDNKKFLGSVFQDYKCQINVMLCIVFLFLIFDEVFFFVYYDIFIKCFIFGFCFNLIDYQFVQLCIDVINNLNLLLEKMISYEFGFQQVLLKFFFLKIFVFYNELRNQVQFQLVFDVFLNIYRIYSNCDFGMVKGLIVSYDFRRIGNICMMVVYIFQFVDGIGFNVMFVNFLIQVGFLNLRNVFFYFYDQCYMFVIIFDYCYGEGVDYNGLMIGDVKLFENIGLNFLFNIYLGVFYFGQKVIINEGVFNLLSFGLIGMINGFRFFWFYCLDVQFDCMFNFIFGKEDKKKMMFLNVYICCINLFNYKNVLSVYCVIGNWNDDGYLVVVVLQVII